MRTTAGAFMPSHKYPSVQGAPLFCEALYRLLSDELHFWQNLGTTVILVVDGKENPIKETVDVKRGDSRKKQVDAWKAYLASGQCSGRKKLNGLAKDACHVTRPVVGIPILVEVRHVTSLVAKPTAETRRML